MQWLGLVMDMGPISAIQADSPAAAAGIQPGDFIRTVDGQPVTDPMTLPDLFRGRGGQTVKLGVERPGKAVQEFPSRPAASDGFYFPSGEDSPLALSSLGIAYRVLHCVREVVPGTPAAAAGLQSGDVITKATILRPDKKTLAQLEEKFPKSYSDFGKEEFLFDEEHRNWPIFMYALQRGGLPEAKVELEWSRGEESSNATLTSIAAKDWFNPDRGFLFSPKPSGGRPIPSARPSAGARRKRSITRSLVFKMIRAMGSGKVSARFLGGPVSIFSVSLQAAKEGMGNLLVFLTLLGANLAVLNFLPIPILDGGHMVFLIWEALRGKPPDERVQLALTYCGLLLILILMVWLLGLDFHLISRTAR